MKKRRKVPLRKCIMTKSMKPKEELIRIVRTKEKQVFVDPTGKKNGRGAYLSKDIQVINEAQESNALEKQFKVKVDSSIYEQLKELVLNEQ